MTDEEVVQAPSKEVTFEEMRIFVEGDPLTLQFQLANLLKQVFETQARIPTQQEKESWGYGHETDQMIREQLMNMRSKLRTGLDGLYDPSKQAYDANVMMHFAKPVQFSELTHDKWVPFLLYLFKNHSRQTYQQDQRSEVYIYEALTWLVKSRQDALYQLDMAMGRLEETQDSSAEYQQRVQQAWAFECRQAIRTEDEDLSMPTGCASRMSEAVFAPLGQMRIEFKMAEGSLWFDEAEARRVGFSYAEIQGALHGRPTHDLNKTLTISLKGFEDARRPPKMPVPEGSRGRDFAEGEYQAA